MVNKPISPNAANLIRELIDELHLTKWQRKRIVWRVRWNLFWYKVGKRLRLWGWHKK